MTSKPAVTSSAPADQQHDDVNPFDPRLWTIQQRDGMKGVYWVAVAPTGDSALKADSKKECQRLHTQYIHSWVTSGEQGRVVLDGQHDQIAPAVASTTPAETPAATDQIAPAVASAPAETPAETPADELEQIASAVAATSTTPADTSSAAGLLTADQRQALQARAAELRKLGVNGDYKNPDKNAISALDREFRTIANKLSNDTKKRLHGSGATTTTRSADSKPRATSSTTPAARQQHASTVLGLALSADRLLSALPDVRSAIWMAVDGTVDNGPQYHDAPLLDPVSKQPISLKDKAGNPILDEDGYPMLHCVRMPYNPIQQRKPATVTIKVASQAVAEALKDTTAEELLAFLAFKRQQAQAQASA